MVDRRDFLKTMAGLTAGLMLPYETFAGKIKGPKDRLGDLLPLRKLGRTGEQITMLGVGGYHIGGSMSDKEAQRTIEAALEGGIRFFDTAESYQDGESEKRYGRYLTPKYREDVFLMTKSTAPDAKTAREHLEGSLRRLNTDYVDLWQVHSLQSPQDVDNRIQNGVLDVFREAKESGKARYIGFTGHHDPHAHYHMLEETDFFYTAQMPINPIDAASDLSFIKKVVPEVTKRNMGLLAMKTLADGRFFASKKRVGWRSDDPVIPNHIAVRDAIHFAWSMPISVLITGADNADMLREKIGLARDFAKLSVSDRQQIIDRVAGFAGGDVEYYKKS